MELKNSMKSVMVSGLCALFLAGQPAWSGTGRNKVPLNNAVSVATGRPKVKYSKMIFGQFIEHFDNQVYGGCTTRSRSLPMKMVSARM